MTEIMQFVHDTLGDYELIYDANDNVVTGIAGLNFPWLVSAFLFCAGFVGIICLGRTFVRCLFGRS